MTYRDVQGMTSIVYARRSKADPARPGKSVADQTELLLAHLEGLGVTVVECLEEEGVGASQHSANAKRGGWERVLAHLASGKVGLLAVWELSRATRRLAVFGSLIEVLEESGILLLVGERIYDLSDEGDRMSLGVNALVSQEESKRIRSRTLRGISRSAVQGRPHGRDAFGFTRIYDPHTRALVSVVVDEAQAGILREMAERILAGETARAIGADEKRWGKVYTATDIRRMVLNPNNIGLRTHCGEVFPAMWPAIFSLDTHSRLLTTFASRSRGGHSTRAKYLLTGLIRCDRCDRAMWHELRLPGTPAAHHIYYCQRCSRSRNAAHLEAFVLDVAEGWLSRDEFGGALEAARTSGPDLRALDAAEVELEDAYSLLADGLLSARAMSTVESRLVPRIKQLKSDVAEPATSPAVLRELRAQGVVTIRDRPVAEQRNVLRSLVRVYVGATARRGRGFDATTIRVVPR
jgi:site-specific DNA recombinase